MTAPNAASGASVRCDLTDLLVDQCAHCQGHTDTAPEKAERTGLPIPARYPGACTHCGQPFAEGDPIAYTAEGWALADHTQEP